MDLRRILIAFAMAAVLAGGCTYVVYSRLRVSAGKTSMIKVVAAADTLPQGITLTNKEIVLLDWPSDVPLTGSFSKPEEVIGRPLIYSLGPKEPILKRDLGISGSGIGLSGRIPPGMRATAVRSNEIVGVAGFLYPGSRVDVLASYTVPGATESRTITQTILQDVEVLTAGQTIEPDPQGKPETVNVVTLLLTPEDSQKLLLTSGQGTVQFVLRSGADKKKVEIHPTRLDELAASSGMVASTAAKEHKVVAGKPAKPAATAATPAHTLEVIQGTQRTVSKF